MGLYAKLSRFSPVFSPENKAGHEVATVRASPDCYCLAGDEEGRRRKMKVVKQWGIGLVVGNKREIRKGLESGICEVKGVKEEWKQWVELEGVKRTMMMFWSVGFWRPKQMRMWRNVALGLGRSYLGFRPKKITIKPSLSLFHSWG